MRTLLSCLLLLGFSGWSPSLPGQERNDGNVIGRFAPVHDLLQQHVDRREIAGAVGLVIDRGRVVYSDAVGWQDVTAKQPMTRDTLFRMASMTKPVTSVAIMMLVEEGKLSLADPLSKYVPEFAGIKVRQGRREGTGGPGDPPYELVPSQREITIHDLLTHTSGLTYGFFSPDPEVRNDGLAEGLVESPLTLEENTRRLAKRPLVAQPGSVWNYGMSTDALGRVVEVASGQTLDRFFHDRIFVPLKMTDTSFVVPAEKLPRLATLYRPNTVWAVAQFAAGDKTIEPVGPGLQHAGPIGFSAMFQHPGATKYLSGGAGLVSTAGDYARFLQMLLNKGELDGVRLLQPETVTLMTRNHIGDLNIVFTIHGDKFGYGFGIHSETNERNGSSIGTYSWGGIFHTYFWVDPKREVIGIVLTQLFPFDHLTLWKDYQQRVYDVLDAKVEPKVSHGPQPGEVWREYEFHSTGNKQWRVTDPDASVARAWEHLPNPVLPVEVADLEHATRAELVIDRWGGHTRTTGRAVRINGREWLPVPPLATPPDGRGDYYYSQDNPCIEAPLSHLHEGTNTVEGTCAALEGYGWGQWGIYSLMLRVYYDPAKKAHPQVKITSPRPGGTIGEQPEVELAVTDGVARADVLAWYDGIDEDGDGVYEEWHESWHQRDRNLPATLAGHVGSDAELPFSVRWDTTWVPDQVPGAVKLMARACDNAGVWTSSEVVDELTLQRPGRVAMYRSSDVPERFGARARREATCTIALPDDAPLDRATGAVVSLRTWNGYDKLHEPWSLNGEEFATQGINHHYDSDLLPAPPSALRRGENLFRVYSETEEHMLEVLWPGPVVVVRYRDAG